VAESLTLDVEKPTAGGRMLARHNGQVVLVWGAIPGERVRARVERTGKGVLFAETIEVVAASADRRDAVADWRCGGNVLAHVAYERQLQLKSEIIRDAFTRIGRLPLDAAPSVTGSPEQGYRMRARLHVRGGRIGFVREGSHDVCAVDQTGQVLPRWSRGSPRRRRAYAPTGWPVSPRSRSRRTFPRMNVLCTSNWSPEQIRNASQYSQTEDVTGVSAQVLDRHGVVTLSGTPMVSDSIGAVRLRRDVRAFFQGNRFLLETLVQRVSAHVPDEPVVDSICRRGTVRPVARGGAQRAGHAGRG
jgi:23S rRNA (uracil1939-C5)-methyltransferase